MPKLIVDLNIDDEFRNNIEKKLKIKNLQIEDYVLELIQNDIKSTINFNDYSFNFLLDKVFYEDKEIKFTNMEMKLFKYLLSNVNSLVRIDDIHVNVWKDKKMTLFTLRNKINSIREKTYYKLIKNISNHGYMMVIEDN
jgi:DNA-binding winged helix-turn-helix (wHTH) protein